MWLRAPILSLVLALTAWPQADAYLLKAGNLIERKEYGRAVNELERALLAEPGRADVHYGLGNALRLWGDTDGAQRALRKALELKPQLAEAHFALGLVLGNRVGQEDQGLAEFQAAVAARPGYAEAHFNIGVIHWKAGRPGEAAQAFARAVELKPNSAAYRLRYAQALERLGRLEEAAAAFEKAVTLDLRDSQAHYQYGLLLRRMNQPERAAEQMSLADRLKKDGAFQRDQSELAYQAGLAALERGRVSEAVTKLQEALTGASEERRVRNALGIALQRAGEWDGAKREFQRVIELQPQSPDGHLNYGALLLRTGDAAGAEREFRAAIATDADFAEAHFNLGLLFASKKQWSEAAESLRTAVRLRPAHHAARWNLARVLRDQGDRDAALQEYEAVCRANRQLSDAHVEYGRLLLAAGEQQRAAAVFQEALRRTPQHRGLQESLLPLLDSSQADAARRQFEIANGPGYQTGLRALNESQFDAAVAAFRKLLDQHPQFEAARRHLAFAYFAQHDYPAAAAENRRLLADAPGDVELRLNLGLALFRAKDAGAETELAKLAEGPAAAQALYHLGLIRSNNRDTAGAMEMFHRARRLDPSIVIPH